jgi:ABC-type Mn2+/Zn2+ transport system ATPase subunit
VAGESRPPIGQARACSVKDVVLKIEGVSKTYPGVRALDRVSIDCRAGEVHAVLGENGSGKTTLMKIASGAISPDDGVVEIGGAVLTAPDPRLVLALRPSIRTIPWSASSPLHKIYASRLLQVRSPSRKCMLGRASN